MKPALLAALTLLFLSSCTTTYPYLVTTDRCNCETFVYHDGMGRFDIEVSAQYHVSDRISSTVNLVFRNRSRDTLSLRQAFLKGSSTNIAYQFNDRPQPMPYVGIRPGGEYAMTLEGSDTQPDRDPWLKIAGEQVVLEIRGMLLGTKPLPPVVLTLIPFNPKLAR